MADDIGLLLSLLPLLSVFGESFNGLHSYWKLSRLLEFPVETCCAQMGYPIWESQWTP